VTAANCGQAQRHVVEQHPLRRNAGVVQALDRFVDVASVVTPARATMNTAPACAPMISASATARIGGGSISTRSYSALTGFEQVAEVQVQQELGPVRRQRRSE
jgi:hypothetical protein